jgi:hypothetical protein
MRNAGDIDTVNVNLLQILIRDAGLIETRASVALGHAEDASRHIRAGDIGEAAIAIASAEAALAMLIALTAQT